MRIVEDLRSFVSGGDSQSDWNGAAESLLSFGLPFSSVFILLQDAFVHYQQNHLVYQPYAFSCGY